MCRRKCMALCMYVNWGKQQAESKRIVPCQNKSLHSDHYPQTEKQIARLLVGVYKFFTPFSPASEPPWGQWSKCRHLLWHGATSLPSACCFLQSTYMHNAFHYVYTSFVSDLVLAKSVAVGKMPWKTLLFDCLLYWLHIEETKSTLRTVVLVIFATCTTKVESD